MRNWQLTVGGTCNDVDDENIWMPNTVISSCSVSDIVPSGSEFSRTMGICTNPNTQYQRYPSMKMKKKTWKVWTRGQTNPAPSVTPHLASLVSHCLQRYGPQARLTQLQPALVLHPRTQRCWGGSEVNRWGDFYSHSPLALMDTASKSFAEATVPHRRVTMQWRMVNVR